MPEYSWRRRHTKHFGNVWVPYAEVEIQAADGRFQAFAMQVDSGAVVSLLRRSAADLLGVKLELGRKIDLLSIGGSQTDAFVHELRSRFGEGIELTVSYAIATTEQVPNLLGRQGVFDTLQVDFDGSLQQTRILAPWLDDNQARIWRHLMETEEHILGRWQDNPLPGRADEAAGQLVRRGAQVLAAITGLLKLHRDFESPLLIRSLFELAIQLEYLVKDPEKRADQYLEFAHVAKYRQSQALVEKPVGFIARTAAQSPARLTGEARMKKQYDRVRSRYARGKKGEWDSWYCKTVHDLADAVGWLAEYNLWYRMCSAWAHADPFQTARHAMLRPAAAFLTPLSYYGRMLLQGAEAKRIVLTAEQYEFLNEFARGVI
jgi:hypothetical protein